MRHEICIHGFLAGVGVAAVVSWLFGFLQVGFAYGLVWLGFPKQIPVAIHKPNTGCDGASEIVIYKFAVKTRESGGR